jgi:hypothetical protein
MIKPLLASLSGTDINWWPEQLIFNPAQTIRRDGAPQEFTTNEISLVPNALAQPVLRTNTNLNVEGNMAQSPAAAAGKGDSLVVERAGKGSLPTTLPALLKGLQEIGQLETN